MDFARNPILTGFNPDPSITVADGKYYICTSTFEYLPGLPIYESTDLTNWQQVGNVVTREGQLAGNSPTNLGAWAPTLRHHDGKFYVTVGDVEGRGIVVFSATSPAGPWDDGVELLKGGYDPDLVWDENGTCYLTYTQMTFSSDSLEEGHGGLRVLPVDLASGAALGPETAIWTERKRFFPEGSHLYRIGEWWYLTVAEGGTDRGHMITLGRSRNLTGPFESHPDNPVLSARSTMNKVQNTGHADLFQTTDGEWAMVILGVRPQGLTNAFSPLGRETFITKVDWVDGWPIPRQVELGKPTEHEFVDAFVDPALAHQWFTPQRLPESVSRIDASGGLVLAATEHSPLTAKRPTLVCKRLQLIEGTVTATVRVAGTGGLVVRYNECANFAIELTDGKLQARFEGYRISQAVAAKEFENTVDGSVTLFLRFKPPAFEFSPAGLGCDVVELGWIDRAGEPRVVAEFDGRYLSQEFNGSFTGRVIGVYCERGSVWVEHFSELGR